MNVICAIKTSFRILGKNFILAQPLVLYLLIFTVLSAGLHTLKSNQPAFIIFSITLLLLGCAFLAGWFYMSKKTISFELDTDLNDEEKAFQSFGLIKHFFPGVGEYFLPMVGTLLFYLICSLIVATLTLKFGLKHIGAIDVDLEQLNKASATVQTMYAYFDSIPPENVVAIKRWFLLIMTAVTGFQFVTIWLFPALFYKSKNPLIAILESIKFLFRKLGATIAIFIFLLIFNFFVSMINSLSAINVFFSLLGFIIFFYFTTYCIVLIFLYYGKNGESSAKDYIYRRDDCDGEKLAGSESGTED